MGTHPQWTFFEALRYFTRLPAPVMRGQDALALSGAMRYFSSVGLIVGVISAFAYGLAHWIWPQPLPVLAAMISAILVTGAMHEDGWSDMVDGFGGACDREKTLEIMRDSRLGGFGAVALILMLAARFFTLAEISPLVVLIALVAGHAVSRLCATFVFHWLDYARAEGKVSPFTNKLDRGDLLFATLMTLPPLVVLFLFSPLQLILALLLAAGATHWLRRLFERCLGGYTGDCLGAVQQLSEVAFYCGLLCRFS